MRILQMMFAVLVCAAAIFTTSPAAAGCMPVTPGSQEEKIFLAAADLIVRAEVAHIETGLPDRRATVAFEVLDVYRSRGAAPPMRVETDLPAYLVSPAYTGEPALSKGGFIQTGKTGIFYFSLLRSQEAQKRLSWGRPPGPQYLYHGPTACPSISDETLKTIIPQR